MSFETPAALPQGQSPKFSKGNGGNRFNPGQRQQPVPSGDAAYYKQPQAGPAGRSGAAAGGSGSVTVIGASQPPPPPPTSCSHRFRDHIEPVPELVALPLEQCPVKPGSSLTPTGRDILIRWGVCTYCRQGRHDKENCPILAEKVKSRPPSRKRK